MVGVLLFIGPEDRPADLVATYRQQLAPGSLLAITHLCDEHAPPEQREQVAAAVAAYQNANEQLHVRTRDEITTWFDGMHLVEPGVVFLPDWRPEPASETADVARPLGYGGVARQP